MEGHPGRKVPGAQASRSEQRERQIASWGQGFTFYSVAVARNEIHMKKPQATQVSDQVRSDQIKSDQVRSDQIRGSADGRLRAPGSTARVSPAHACFFLREVDLLVVLYSLVAR